MDLMRIHSMKEKLTEWALCELEKGKECVDTEEMGQVVDMIKDLADAEKNCYEAKILKMEHEDLEEMERQGGREGRLDRMGYDNWRYSSGRFAPTGRGHRSGYMNPSTMFNIPDDGYYGYQGSGMSGGGGASTGTGQSGSRGSGSSQGQSGSNSGRGGYSGQGGTSGRSQSGSRMGYDDQMMWETPWDRYEQAKRHFHETGSKQDKDEMSEHAKEHLEESFETMRDIWKEADPQMKQRMKADLQVLMNELK